MLMECDNSPDKDAEEMRKSMLSISVDDEQQQILEELIDKFIQFKLAHYKDDKRFIVDFQLDTAGGALNLHIASTPLGESVFKDSSRNQKVERNDPCPCGSGKKYKKCCGK